MTKQMLKNKLPVVLALVLVCSVLHAPDAFAWGGHGHYSYREGRWYNSGWFWGGLAAALTVGAIVATLPPRHETVYVSGVPYYYYDNTYYRPCPTGYVVVPTPSIVAEAAVPAEGVIPAAAAPVVAQPEAVSGEISVVNIPDASGGFTPVTLTRYKTGYVGPQGEYYDGHPTVERLKVLYGK